MVAAAVASAPATGRWRSISTGLDTAVIGMNRDAAARLRCHQDMAIVPGATHLFQEPGKLDQVQDLAARWFLRHLAEDNAHGS